MKLLILQDKLTLLNSCCFHDSLSLTKYPCSVDKLKRHINLTINPDETISRLCDQLVNKDPVYQISTKILHYKVTKPSKQLDSFNKSMQEKQGNEHIWCTEQPNLALTLCVVKSRLHSSQKQSLLSATLSMSIENVINHNAIPHKVSPHGHLATLCTSLRVT